MKMWWKATTDASKDSFLLSWSRSKGHMSDMIQKIWDLNFHYCNNDISFTSAGTRACGLGILSSWMVHETLACLAY